MLLYVWKDGKCYCIENDYVVKNFGDVEVYDLTIHLMGTQQDFSRRIRKNIIRKLKNLSKNICDFKNNMCRCNREKCKDKQVSSCCESLKSRKICENFDNEKKECRN